MNFPGRDAEGTSLAKKDAISRLIELPAKPIDSPPINKKVVPVQFFYGFRLTLKTRIFGMVAFSLYRNIKSELSDIKKKLKTLNRN